MTNKSIEEESEAFVSEEKEVASVADAIAGAKDIIAEHISDEADYRIHIRDLTAKKGTTALWQRSGDTVCLRKCITNLKSRQEAGWTSCAGVELR